MNGKSDGVSEGSRWHLALLPFIGYAAAFAYEVGLLRPFAAPIELIQADSTHILINALVTLTILSGLCSFVVFALMVLRPGDSVVDLIEKILDSPRSSIVVPLSFLVWLWFIGSIRWWLLMGVGTWVGVQLLRDFGPSKTRGFSGFKFPKALSLGACVLLFMFVAMEYGDWSVRRQRTWTIPRKDPNSVVVRIYGDKAICAPVSWERGTNGTVERSCFVLEMKGTNFPNGRFEIDEKDIGLLHFTRDTARLPDFLDFLDKIHPWPVLLMIWAILCALTRPLWWREAPGP